MTSSLHAFWAGRLSSSFGSTLGLLGLQFYCISSLHVAPATLSAVLSAPLVVALLSPLFVGVLVDSYDRKALFVTAELLRLMAAVGLAVVALAGSSTIAIIMALSCALALGEAVSVTCLTAGLPDIVGLSGLERANGRFQAINTFTASAGAAAGGWIFSLVGPVMGFVIDAVSYLVSAITVTVTPWPKARRQASAREPWRKAVVGGFRQIANIREFRILVIVNVVCNFFISLSVVALLIFLVDVQDFPFSMYTVVLGFGSLGALVGVLALRRVSYLAGMESRKAQTVALISYGFFLAAYYWVPAWSVEAVVVAMAADFGIGFFLSIFLVHNSSRLQRIIAGEVRGRAAAARRAFRASASLGGTAVAGVIVGMAGSRFTLLICGIGLILAAGWFGSALRKPIAEIPCGVESEGLEPP